MNVVPNQTPLPSSINNNPELSPFLGGRMLDLGDVPITTALVAPDGTTGFTPESATTLLMALRSEFPFMPIIPLPTSYESVFLDTAGFAEDIFIPNGCSLMMIRGSADYYMSTYGNAAVPTAVNTLSSANANKVKSFYAPQGLMFYVGGISSISIVSPTASTIVTAMFWTPDQMPR